MRRLWFGLPLLLAPLGLVARGVAGEVIATSKPRQPIVAAATSTAVTVPDEIHPVAYQEPVVELGRPRVTRGAATSPFGLLPLKRRETPSREVLPGTAAFNSTPSTPVSSLPSSTTVTVGRPILRTGDAPTNFAIERTGALLPEPGLLPVANVSTMEQLPMPKSAGTTASSSSASPSAEYVVGDPSDLFLDNGVGSSPPNRFYASAEYLLWTTKDANIPPLVTTAPVLGGEGAPVGDPNTTVLFGGKLDHGAQSGARFRVGYWFDCDKPFAIEASYFFLGQQNDPFSAGSPNPGLIARPFFNLNRQVESSQLVAIFNQQLGRIDIDSPSRLQGADLNLRCGLCCGDTCQGNYKLDLFGGFRWLQLDESLVITEQGVVVNVPGIPANQRFLIQDSFATKNNFYGGQLGLVGEWKRGKWSVETRGSVALGVTHQTVDINGFAVFQNPGQAPVTATGGLLALNSNIGHYSRNQFSVVPEIGVKLGYQVTDRLRATVGYNFLYWSNVVRPGDQIDRGLDTRLIPNFLSPAQLAATPAPIRPGPVFDFKDTSYWAQGLTLGLEFKY